MGAPDSGSWCWRFGLGHEGRLIAEGLGRQQLRVQVRLHAPLLHMKWTFEGEKKRCRGRGSLSPLHTPYKTRPRHTLISSEVYRVGSTILISKHHSSPGPASPWCGVASSLLSRHHNTRVVWLLFSCPATTITLCPLAFRDSLLHLCVVWLTAIHSSLMCG